MTTNLKQKSEPNIVARRLREAREETGFSRAQLGRKTNIPVKSIEKFEYGTLEPSLSRLQTLCDTLDVSTHWVMGEGDEDFENAPPAHNEEPVLDPSEKAKGILSRLDILRGEGFRDAPRMAMALADQALAGLKSLEPDELVTMANERRLQKGDCLSSSDLWELFGNDPEAGQSFCGQIEERILDTALLGIDLYTLDRDPLVVLADRLSENHPIEMPGFLGFSWGDHEDFVPLIRPVLRNLALAGGGEDFQDGETYPKRS
jgi:transcriptional regulator with XRE-family HTH domain